MDCPAKKGGYNGDVELPSMHMETELLDSQGVKFGLTLVAYLTGEYRRRK